MPESWRRASAMAGRSLAIAEALRQLSGIRRADLVRQRQSRIAAYGKFKEVTA